MEQENQKSFLEFQYATKDKYKDPLVVNSADGKMTYLLDAEGNLLNGFNTETGTGNVNDTS